jgi:hypothetical protein
VVAAAATVGLRKPSAIVLNRSPSQHTQRVGELPHCAVSLDCAAERTASRAIAVAKPAVKPTVAHEFDRRSAACDRRTVAVEAQCDDSVRRT